MSTGSIQKDYIVNIRDRFHLSEKFLEKYKGRQPNWGPVGYVTYKRTYSRVIPDENRTEEFWETLKRVVEGCYTIQLNHCKNLRLPWIATKAQKSAQEMFRLMWEFKFLPPGRGLWAMGTDLVYLKGSACLQNCGVASTEDIGFDFSGPFVWLMDMSLFGVGVAFDLKGTNKVKIQEPKIGDYTHVVEDSKEGWCEIVRVILESYVGKDRKPKSIDYSQIRPNGSPIKTFGGIAPGPEPLMKCVSEIEEILNSRIEQRITSADIVDLMNCIGKCVVSGGVRRTAELALGDPNDTEYLELKNPEKYKDKMIQYRWASNNSVLAYEGMNYDSLVEQTIKSGEPGYIYLDNIRKYGRIKDGINWLDKDACGVNPCGEQSLENQELCCLCSTFPSLHDSFEEYIHTLKFAYLYTKTVTLIPTHNERTNQVMLKNRRMGISMGGVVDAMNKFGKRHFLSDFCDKGYQYIKEIDRKYSRWLCIPESIKLTTVKPDGTVSLLAGVSPGMHFPHSEYYIRRIEVQKNSELVDILDEANVPKEQSVYKENSWVFEFPVKSENYKKGKNEVTIWEQMELNSLLQYYWSDNNISHTVTFSKEEETQLKDVLEYYEDRIKSVSFSPLKIDAYEQTPYEEITEEEYIRRSADILQVNLETVSENEGQETNKYCDGGSCSIEFKRDDQ